jgi:ribose transport system substrate-binding protein
MRNSSIRSRGRWSYLNRRSLRAPLTVIVAALALAACGSSGGTTTEQNAGSQGNASSTSTASSASKPSGTVGFLAWQTGVTPFVDRMVTSLKQNASELGVNLQAENGNDDLTTQIGDLREFIVEKVKAIIVFPPDPKSWVPVLNQAAAAGIPVINLGAKLESSAKVLTYVGDNDYEYGKEEAEAVINALHGKGQVALADGFIGKPSQIYRTAGIHAAFATAPGIKLVATAADNQDAQQDLALTQSWVTKFPQLSAIMSIGPYINGAAQWAHTHGHSSVKFFALDYPSYMAQAIKNGTVYGTGDQDPVLEGQRAAQAAYWVLTGQQSKVPTPNWYIQVPFITKANVDKIKPTW